MSIPDIIKGKKKWRLYMARVKTLPRDYRSVYKEIKKYLFKVGPVEVTEGFELLYGIIDLFEEGAAAGKGVTEIIGSDAASFCDDLIKGSKTYADICQEFVDRSVAGAMKKAAKKTR